MAAEHKNEFIPPAPPLSETGEVQKAASADATQELVKYNDSENGLEQYPSSEAVQLLAETGGFRNPGAKAVLHTLCQLRETDLRDARVERKQAQDELNLLRENYHSERTKRLVLEERLRGEVPMKRLQNIFTSMGGILLGAGLQPLVVGFSFPYFILFLVGLVLLLVGLFYPGHSRKEQS
jgi:hypothetical protein